MNKKSKIIALAAMAAMAFGSLGCSERAEVIAKRTDKYGNTVVTVLFHKDRETPEGNAYARVVSDYMENNKGVVVEAEYVTQTTGVNMYETTITAKFAAGGGELYDIITYDSPKTSEYASNGILCDSTDLLGDYVNEFLPASVQKYNNRVYGLPIQEASCGFFINLSIAKQAGITATQINNYKTKGWKYTDFYEVCRKLKSKSKYAVDFQLGSSDIERRTFFMYPFGYTGGGEYCSADGKTVTGYFNGEKVAAGLEIIQECIDNGYTSKNIPAETAFCIKEAGMMLSSGWVIPKLKGDYASNFSGGYGVGWDILPYPYKDDEKANAASATGSWCFGITNNGVADKSAAVEFLKYLTSKTGAEGISQATGMLNARKDAQYGANTPEKFLYDQLAATGKSRPIMPGYAYFSTEFNLMLDDVALKKGALASILNAHATTLQSNLNI